eukprot:8236770-Heterocapsa_arctica.AAC.1
MEPLAPAKSSLASASALGGHRIFPSRKWLFGHPFGVFPVPPTIPPLRRVGPSWVPSDFPSG